MKTMLSSQRTTHAIALGVACALQAPAPALERLEPAFGCYFGISVSSEHSVSDARERLGITPAVYVRFFSFPVSSLDKVAAFLQEVANVGGIASLTLEPWNGLEPIDQNVCNQLAELCANYEKNSGIAGIFIRLGHEMNGNWYPWGQRPILFKAKFRQLSEIIHVHTEKTAMVWAPNYGIGYPFGTPVPVDNSADFQALDTNNDGLITDRDDMYEPYYPGDDVVDWVGMTIYHWGIDYPWLENEMPPAASFAKSLFGKHQGNIPNFYLRYCAGAIRKKPMVVPETSAFYNTERVGPAEIAIKRAWWQQVFNLGADKLSPDIPTTFPKLKCIGWFDEFKRESVAQNNLIDWRISANEEIRTAFVGNLRTLRNGYPYFLVAAEANCILRQQAAGEPIEFCLGEPGDPLKFTLQNGNLVIGWLPKEGYRYQLLQSVDMQQWQPVGETYWGVGRPLTASVDLQSSSSNPQAFFRLQAVQEE
jgi:hypothetical protein